MIHPLEALTHQAVPIQTGTDPSPLPCEAGIDPREAQHPAFFERLASIYGRPIKRISPDSLRVTRPFDLQVEDLLPVQLPVFHLLDPMTRFHLDSLTVDCDQHRTKIDLFGIRHSEEGLRLALQAGQAADATLEKRGVLGIRLIQDRCVGMTGSLWLSTECHGVPHCQTKRAADERAEARGYVWAGILLAALSIGVALLAITSHLEGREVAGWICLLVILTGITIPTIIRGVCGFADAASDRASSIRATGSYVYCRIPGVIPAEARTAIRQACEVASQVGGEVRLLMEAEWALLRTTVEPSNLDPLIVIVRGDDIALIDRFDCTPREHYLASEHAIQPQVPHA